MFFVIHSGELSRFSTSKLGDRLKHTTGHTVHLLVGWHNTQRAKYCVWMKVQPTGPFSCTPGGFKREYRRTDLGVQAAMSPPGSGAFCGGLFRNAPSGLPEFSGIPSPL